MFLNKSALNSLRNKINICCLWHRVSQGIKGSDSFSTNTRDSKAITQITVVLYSILNLQRLVIILSACSRLMIHRGESSTGFTVQLSAYMQWPGSLNNIYINYKLLWKKSNVSKSNFSFIHSSVDHITLIPRKFFCSWVRRMRELNYCQKLQTCNYMQMNAYIKKKKKPQLDTDTSKETPVKLFSHATSDHFYCNINIIL